jgi:hypothetical protein
MALVLLPKKKRGAPVSKASVRKRKPVHWQRTADSQLGFEGFAPRLQAAAMPMVPVIQTKLKVGKPNDKFEQEAERVAEMVMRMPEPQALERAALRGSASPTRIQRVCRECEKEISSRPVPIQRMCPECEEELHQQPMEKEEEKETIQSKEISDRTPEVTPDVQAQINGIRDDGQPFPESVRAFFEPRFGMDFRGVRVHADARAAQLVRAVNARAFTVGRDVFFGAGEYAPEIDKGRRLLAHELAHVIQQNTSTYHRNQIRRQPIASKFERCALTGIRAADLKVENARQRAIDYLQVAIRDLKRSPTDPAATKAYRIGLQRHFINPDDKSRATIRSNYERILGVLKARENIVCALFKDELEHCKKTTEPVAFVITGESTIRLCPVFFDEGITCRAIVLIHEAAHAIGIGIQSPHPPYRGSGEYPWPHLAAATPETQTPAMRMDNPDAYGYFAAHIWRETDTSCPPPFPTGPIVIEIVEEAP